MVCFAQATQLCWLTCLNQHVHTAYLAVLHYTCIPELSSPCDKH